MAAGTALNPAIGARPVGPLGVSIEGWVATAIITLLMVATFRFNLVRLWGKTNPFTGEAEWQHAIIVPFVGLYYLYMHREELREAKREPLLLKGHHTGRLWGAGGLALLGLVAMFVGPQVAPTQAGLAETAGYGLLALAGMVLALNWGLAMMVFGLLFFGYGIWPGQNDYFKDLGMVATLFGVVLTLCGWQVMKIAWFPIAFLICALPWPGLFYSLVAGPLQELAATVAVWVLQHTGVPDAWQGGTKIHTGGGRTLNVAEACAGLKSLMTFVTLGGAIAFLSSRPLWQKIFLVLMAVPVAIGCNVIRVTGQGLLDAWTNNSEWSQNFAHQFVGLVMVVPAFFVLLGIGWVLDQLFVDQADEESKAAIERATRGEGANADVLVAAPRARTAGGDGLAAATVAAAATGAGGAGDILAAPPRRAAVGATRGPAKESAKETAKETVEKTGGGEAAGARELAGEPAVATLPPRAAVQPALRPAGRPGGQPAGQSAGQSGGQPAGQSGPRPVGRSVPPRGFVPPPMPGPIGPGASNTEANGSRNEEEKR